MSWESCYLFLYWWHVHVVLLSCRFYSHMYDSQVNHVILIDPLSSELFSHHTFKHYWKTEVLDKVQVCVYVLWVKPLRVVSYATDNCFLDNCSDKSVWNDPIRIKSAALIYDIFQFISSYPTHKEYSSALIFAIFR